MPPQRTPERELNVLKLRAARSDPDLVPKPQAAYTFAGRREEAVLLPVWYIGGGQRLYTLEYHGFRPLGDSAQIVRGVRQD